MSLSYSQLTVDAYPMSVKETLIRIRDSDMSENRSFLLSSRVTILRVAMADFQPLKSVFH